MQTSHTDKYCGNCWFCGLYKKVDGHQDYWFCRRHYEKHSRDCKVEYRDKACEHWESQRYGELRDGVSRK